MEKRQAQTIVKETFQRAFNKESFIRFVKELLNHVELASFVYRGNTIPDAYEQHISTLERVGKYTDGEHEIDILIVKLKKSVSIERARTMQRNFIAWYLNGSRGDKLKDAALVAFVSPDEQDWRFSLVKMEYKFKEGKNKRIKVKEEFTPAKRWSFLVGANENSHTAQSRLVPIVEDDEHNPTLQQLEDAFNIEKVTKEFFDKYRDLFLRVSETLQVMVDKNARLKKDFTDKNVSITDFSKKLLGQIVFLYFLQKKGWFGVPMNRAWGEGDKKFMRTLFTKAQSESKNYFNNFLEPLFYEALAKERDEDFYSRFESKIPFLNGGLFDPISNYDWVNTAIDLPDDLFSNTRKTKQGDIGDGILDIFDRYNFTVKEDEPLEKEVAVDPEMLGKVFENLLEVKDRKSKGTYYTPREIVHYMCKQSLINYLATELEGKVGKEDIEQLVKYGETVGENETFVENEGKETPTYYYKLPELIRDYAEDIDTALATIKVCDPAIGSGAFPVGMMSEIVKARSVLTAYLKDSDRTVYNFKRDCIQNSLYGVDIDPGAVEIAKLRLWLSLVVDEDDIKQIKPLPNLDYKIMQGNSLLEEFEGVKLFDEKLLSTPIIDARIFEKDNQKIISLQSKLLVFYKEHPEWLKKKKITKPQEVVDLEIELRSLLQKTKHIEPNNSEQRALFTGIAESKKIRDELTHLHKKFFEETSKSKKDQLRKQVDALEWQLIETTLREEKKTSALEKLEQFKHANVKPFFLWKLHFADVFEEKGGFDVVIANPPYIEFKKLPADQKVWLNKYKSAKGKYDIYVIFDERSIMLLKPGGVLCLIQPTTFLKKDYGEQIRNVIRENFKINAILDFSDIQVFEAVTNYTGVFIFEKSIGSTDYSFPYHQYFRSDKPVTISDFQSSMSENYSSSIKNYLTVNQKELNKDEWNFQDDTINKLLEKINLNAKPLQEFTESIFQGIASGKDEVFYIDEKIIKLYKIESGIIKKLIKGKDVKRYKINWSRHYVIFPYDQDSKVLSETVLENNYPNALQYLKKNRELLKGREYFDNSSKKWFELWNQRNVDDFKKNRIVCPEITDKNNFVLTDLYYGNTKTYHIIPKDKSEDSYKYFLGLLNSKLLDFIYKKISTPQAGGYYAYKSQFLSKLPIIIARDPRPITGVVDQILSVTKSEDYSKSSKKQEDVLNLERKMDGMVYKLYELTNEEIKVVEGN